MNNETLPSIHWYDRVRQIIAIALAMFGLEIGRPWPFLQTWWGTVAYGFIVFFAVKNAIRYRRERSIRFNKRVIRWKKKYDKYFLRFSDNTRYRIFRVARIAAIVFIWGALVNSLTDKCNDSLSCVVATPGLILANFQEILFFMIRIVLGMATLIISTWTMSKTDTYDTILPHTIKTRFDNVFGQSHAVKQVKEVVEILNDPEYVESLGGYMPGGIMLWGPPGTGKSLIAEAIAGETHMPYVLCGAGSFASMWSGVPTLKVKGLYRHLRKLSLKYGGVVVFFDEIDSLGSRGGLGNRTFFSEGSKVGQLVNRMTIQSGNSALQMLLSEMSGVQKPRGLYNKIRVILGFNPIEPPKYRILHVAATNLISTLDEALLRPGRYDRIIEVGLPNRDGVAETFRGYLAKVNHALTEEDIVLLAANNAGMSGASVQNTVNEALLKAVREGREIIEWGDLRDSIIERNLGEDRGRAPYAPDIRRVALHEAAHAFAALKWRKHVRIQFASIIRRRGTAGVVSGALAEERIGKTRNELESEIIVSLASVWAENYYFDGDISQGPAHDLQNATNIAKAMWGQYAMGGHLLSLDTDALPANYMEEIEDYLSEIYEIIDPILRDNRDVIELFAEELDRQGTVDGTVLQEIYDRMSV